MTYNTCINEHIKSIFEYKKSWTTLPFYHTMTYASILYV